MADTGTIKKKDSLSKTSHEEAKALSKRHSKSQKQRAIRKNQNRTKKAIRNLHESKRLQIAKFSEIWAPNFYIEEREGHVLSRGMILKSDFFPTNKMVGAMDVIISGGPNYRRIGTTPLCCVGQPTVNGIRTMLNFAIGAPGIMRIPYSNYMGPMSMTMNINMGPHGHTHHLPLGMPQAPSSQVPIPPIPSGFHPRSISTPNTMIGNIPSGYGSGYDSNHHTPIPPILTGNNNDINNNNNNKGLSPNTAQQRVTVGHGLMPLTATTSVDGNDYNSINSPSGGGHSSGQQSIQNEQAMEYDAKCVWINLREEPVVYINNRPFVLREYSHPFKNMQSFRGIKWNHLFEVEARLKHDIIDEARKHHNVLIHDEMEAHKVRACWEAVTHATVDTSKDVFDRLRMEGYDVSYYRVPTTPEMDLKLTSIDSMCKIVFRHLKFDALFWNIATQPIFVFNCQIGLGRSTVACILVWLIFLKIGLIDNQGEPITHRSIASRLHNSSSANNLQNLVIHSERGGMYIDEPPSLAGYLSDNAPNAGLASTPRQGGNTSMMEARKRRRKLQDNNNDDASNKDVKTDNNNNNDISDNNKNNNSKIMDNKSTNKNMNDSGSGTGGGGDSSGSMKKHEHKNRLDKLTMSRAPSLPTRLAGYDKSSKSSKSSKRGILGRRPSVDNLIYGSDSGMGNYDSDDSDASGINGARYNVNLPIRGDYSIIRQIMRIVKNGSQAKQNVDDAIEACGQVYNLQYQLSLVRMQLENARTTDEKNLALYANVMTVSRYATLLCFAAYLLDLDETTLLTDATKDADALLLQQQQQQQQQQQGVKSHHKRKNKKLDRENLFSYWMEHKYPALLKIKKDFVKNATYESLMRSFIVSGSDVIDTVKSPIEAFIMQRNGNVLQGRMIIKTDDFASKAQELLKQRFLRPTVEQQISQFEIFNFRFLEDVGVATVAQAPLEIIEAILSEKLDILENTDPLKITVTSSENNNNNKNQTKNDNTSDNNDDNKSQNIVGVNSKKVDKKPGILWIDLREEPVLYIHSQPYVLRRLKEPFMILDEFEVGLTGNTIRDVSTRLKLDIVNECKASKESKILVQSDTRFHEMKDEYIKIENVEKDIMTSSQAFKYLQSKGHDIEYIQLPYNPRNIFEYDQLDKLGKIIHDNVATDRTLVFSDKNGVHRSTVATIVTTLISYHRGLLQFLDEHGDVDLNVQLASPFSKSFSRLPYSKKRETLATLSMSSMTSISNSKLNDILENEPLPHGNNEKKQENTVARSVDSTPTKDENENRKEKLASTPERDTTTGDEEDDDEDEDEDDDDDDDDDEPATSNEKNPGLTKKMRSKTVDMPLLSPKAPKKKRLQAFEENETETDSGTATGTGSTDIATTTSAASASGSSSSTSDDSSTDGSDKEKNVNNNNNNNNNTSSEASKKNEETNDKKLTQIEEEQKDGQGSGTGGGAGEEEETARESLECRAVLALIRILRNGRKIKNQVDSAIDYCGDYYDIKSAMYDARSKWESSRNEMEGAAHLEEALRHLQTYTSIICFNAYLYEYYYALNYNKTKHKKYKLISFQEWMTLRAEISVWRKEMIAYPETAISLGGTNDKQIKKFAQIFESRQDKGNVLTKNAMLKIDYFPGCAQLQPSAFVPAAINFRFIDTIGVAGCAIPTQTAITQVVTYLGSFSIEKQHKKQLVLNTSDESSSTSSDSSGEEEDNDKHNDKKMKKKKNKEVIGYVRWLCMREEPVLYVKQEPVVLRELHSPYENLVYTGITKKRVEALERTLCNDAIEECGKFDNTLLIHGETDTGNLEAERENITKDEILTCSDAFNSSFRMVEQNLKNKAINSGNNNNNMDDENSDVSSIAQSQTSVLALLGDCKIDAKYFRVPITDEQAPLPRDFDILITVFETEPLSSQFVFNCQMGRGRTTTGMVIYALWKRKVYYRIKDILISERRDSSFREISTMQLNKYNTDNKTVLAWLNGEYTGVLNLLRILPQGLMAKQWVDAAIDVLSHMQNLRHGIYDIKLRSESAVKERTRQKMHERMINYLRRYCMLIAFASYLLTKYKTPVKIAKDIHYEFGKLINNPHKRKKKKNKNKNASNNNNSNNSNNGNNNNKDENMNEMDMDDFDEHSAIDYANYRKGFVLWVAARQEIMNAIKHASI